MSKYEYRTVETEWHELESVLNDYGATGWRLKKAHNNLAKWNLIFERGVVKRVDISADVEFANEPEDSGKPKGKTIEGLLIAALLATGPMAKGDLIDHVEKAGVEMDLYYQDILVPQLARTIVVENLLRHWIQKGLIGLQEGITSPDEHMIPHNSVVVPIKVDELQKMLEGQRLNLCKLL